MKLSSSNLALVALNVAWLAAASYFIAKKLNERAVNAPVSVQYVTNFMPVAPVIDVAPAEAAGPARTNDFRWAQLESEDYRTYIERLRSIGCPEQTIRDIVIADVDKLFAPRLQASVVGPRDPKYWEPTEQQLWEGLEQREALRQQRTMDFEKREVIRELLGVDLVGERLRNQGQNDYYGQRLSFLPEEKRARVRLVMEQYADREQAIMEGQLGDDGASTGGEDIGRVRREKQAVLSQLLTPSEREQYDLWFSESASRVRDAVYGMDATEEEFLKLYQLRRQFDAQHGDAIGTADPARAGAMSGAEHQLDAQIHQALGEERYAEYRRAQDPDFRELFTLTSRFKLPKNVATELYSYKEPVQLERVKVQTDATLTSAQKEAAVKAITEETQRAFKETLGEKAFRQFIRRTGNRWVRGE